MLLATQRPDAKVFEGQIKANCPFAICFQVKNGVNSRIVVNLHINSDLVFQIIEVKQSNITSKICTYSHSFNPCFQIPSSSALLKNSGSVKNSQEDRLTAFHRPAEGSSS